VVGVSYGTVIALQIVANGNTVDSTIEFFTDAALTDRIYYAPTKDCYSSPHDDRTPWACLSFTQDLESDSLHYRIQNNGANNSTYTIKVVGIGIL
jgi:hypothetical protein